MSSEVYSYDGVIVVPSTLLSAPATSVIYLSFDINRLIPFIQTMFLLCCFYFLLSPLWSKTLIYFGNCEWARLIHTYLPVIATVPMRSMIRLSKTVVFVIHAIGSIDSKWNSVRRASSVVPPSEPANTCRELHSCGASHEAHWELPNKTLTIYQYPCRWDSL